MDKIPFPLLIYDGECGFCKKVAERILFLSNHTISILPFQEAPLIDKEELDKEEKGGDGKEKERTFLPIRKEDAEKEVYLFLSPTTFFRGARAFLELSRWGIGDPFFLFLYTRWEGLALFSEKLYQWVARHRHFAGRITHLLFGDSFLPPGYRRTIRILLASLSIVYCFAFLSLLVQARGLYGNDGIFPVVEYFSFLRKNGVRFSDLPSLLWLSPHYSTLTFLLFGGIIVSILSLFYPHFFFYLLLFLFYLSVVNGGWIWMNFQWDYLLLEGGFLAVVVSLFRKEWDRYGFFLLLPFRALLFKLLFLSGIRKILGGDPSWKDLTALTYHFFTQPLPHSGTIFFHHLPVPILKGGVLFTYFVECLLPFFAFSPWFLRRFLFFGNLLFQILLILSGNFGFFNYLTIALSFSLFTDRSLPLFSPPSLPPSSRLGKKRALLAIVVYLTVGEIVSSSWEPKPFPMQTLFHPLIKINALNRYGLFVHMTKDRLEIVFEGSRDGVHFLPYPFRYKPWKEDTISPILPFHMPRFDWQLWFASLSTCFKERWVYRVLLGLKENEEGTLSLFDGNPFSTYPPAVVRARIIRFRFTSLKTFLQSGKYWETEDLGLFCPPVERVPIRKERKLSLLLP
jgi:hypothetical protein